MVQAHALHSLGHGTIWPTLEVPEHCQNVPGNYYYHICRPAIELSDLFDQVHWEWSLGPKKGKEERT